MTEQNEEVKKSDEQVIKQARMMLPFLPDEVPVLYLADDQAYIPVYMVCQAFGIDAKGHIQRWRKLLLWVTARKLPFQSPSGRRRVWCLLLSQIPSLYSLFDWKLVSPERREQLREANKKGIELAWRAQQELLLRYRTTRQDLFQFLAMSENRGDKLIEYEQQLSHVLDSETALTLAKLIGRGIELYTEARAHAKKMIQDQANMPIVDLYEIDEQNEVIEESAMPLLPVLNEEDQKKFAEWLLAIAHWHLDMAKFCLTHCIQKSNK